MNTSRIITVCCCECEYDGMRHPFAIRIYPIQKRVEYDPLDGTGSFSATLTYEMINNIEYKITKELVADRPAPVWRKYHFRIKAHFDKWRREVQFSDDDVSWYIIFEDRSGELDLHICTDHSSVPDALYRIERSIKNAMPQECFNCAEGGKVL